MIIHDLDIEMCEYTNWEDWPQQSFDDVDCSCDRLDNHTFCKVHGWDQHTGVWRTPEDYIIRLLTRGK